MPCDSIEMRRIRHGAQYPQCRRFRPIDQQEIVFASAWPTPSRTPRAATSGLVSLWSGLQARTLLPSAAEASEENASRSDGEAVRVDRLPTRAAVIGA